jgi:sterol desaturase/sphingolipid hydroxylase (fatty acid hydroxylase superfamily)
MDTLIHASIDAQQLVFETLLLPVMLALGLDHRLEDGYAAAGWLLLGVLQVLLIASVLRGLERWKPAESQPDRAARRADVLYTLLHRLGVVRVALYFTLVPLLDGLLAQARLWGFAPPAIDAWWPALSQHALLSFVVYLVVFDFFEYLYHRAQHAFNPWWALHALHHSQRQLSCWSDDRNHLLDDVIHAAAFAVLAWVLGVPPAQFMALVVVTELLESLSHTNVQLRFGPLRWVLVSPVFHRRHHAIGVGHESSGPGSLGGCNFGVLFPVWDVLFGTADFRAEPVATGIRDQLEGREYGRGVLAQQWLGLRRLFGGR